MIPVQEAIARALAQALPIGTETVRLAEAAGRILAEDAVATRAQPPFPASAMDGYAMATGGLVPGATYRVVGEAAAGRSYAGEVRLGEAVRIFTGAPLPLGAGIVVIQEDVTREGDTITLLPTLGPEGNVRPAGSDFAPGFRLAAPRVLSAADVALLAAMNLPSVRVARRPDVALLPTGDELVMPGEAPGLDQIVASNVFGLKAMAETTGARARLLPVARDREDLLQAAFQLAGSADLVVTIGGASVGDHDLVAGVAARLGFDMAFHKVAMRPGKPLMLGRSDRQILLGLPGNPVSALVCGQLFMAPMLKAMQGHPEPQPARGKARLGEALGKNGPREHYMRSRLEGETITPYSDQDSSLLSVLAEANALLIRAPHEPPLAAGTEVPYIPL